ncbi:MAG: IS30 family transposase [Candidatus Saccharimonadales bacterium]
MKTTAYKRLTAEEREEISRSLAQGHTLGQIARQLKRETSTMSRELSRLRYTPKYYRATFAQEMADAKRNHRKTNKLLVNKRLRDYVHHKILVEHWSPQQIAARLKLEYPNDMSMRVSHETIYTYVFCLARGSLKKELKAALRQHRRSRGSKRPAGDRTKHSPIPDLVSIDERPKEVEDRIIPGHWEGDLIIGKGGHSALGTLVERTTRTVILVPVASKHAEHVAARFAAELTSLPEQMKLTLTYDCGSEMARHKLFTEQTKMQVYFADPQSPWQRGTNENTNGLIRQFFPKGTEFTKISRVEVKYVQDLLNSRPRKALEFRTPYEAFSQLLAEKGEATANEVMLR